MGVGSETARRLARQLQGVGRRVDDDVREILTAQSRWLFDLARSRFQRCPPPQNLHQALAFGSWLPLTDVRVEEGRFLVVEPRHQHPVRAEIAAKSRRHDETAPMGDEVASRVRG